MQWNLLLNNSRRKDCEKNTTRSRGDSKNEGSGREEIERDYDRILFLAPTRRLADKTQVFPLEQNDSVRTRLTHSYEVSNLARSIGTQLAFDKAHIFADNKLETRNSKLERVIPSLLAAIGLAHDLGNPPFGHQGEKAIQHWFNINRKFFPENDERYNDFFYFDGNSQTLRLLTKLQILNDRYGINLTYATLASVIKYPRSSHSSTSNQNWKKHGFFYSEKEIVEEVWEETGLGEGLRHPLTYIMEACDDIAYSVLDAEDIVKKGLASFQDLIQHLESYSKECRDNTAAVDVVNTVIRLSLDKFNEFKKNKLTPSELNDVSMQMFRVFAITELVKAVLSCFEDKLQSFMSISEQPKDIISNSDGVILCKALKEFDMKWGYTNKSVLKLELEGFNYIHNLMNMLWLGVHGRLDKKSGLFWDTPFGNYAYRRISENYRRIFEDENNVLPVSYKEAQLLTDAVSGMTDSYLISLHNELEAMCTHNFDECKKLALGL